MHDNVYRAMWEAFVGYGDGFLLIYSITSRSSFEEIPALLQEILRVKRKDFVPTILVANKCDLEHERQVSTDEGQEMAKQLGARLIETSATQMINVGEPFYDLVREIRRFRKDTYNSHDQSSNQLDNKENKGCCCRIM
ncbi:protein ras-1 [Dissophora ornata]|nr:Ras GTPase [Dissophora ornata]KAI8603309.1 protein ras-1 [Dissophora ornata]